MAVKDAQKLQNTPGYVLDMGIYHHQTYNGECHVCMAGAVIACRLGYKQHQEAVPKDFGRETEKALDAIDAMRKGQFGVAADLLGVRPDDLSVLDYASKAVGYYSPDGGLHNKLGRSSWDSYIAAARILEHAGL
jgi:hypothetical protein